MIVSVYLIMIDEQGRFLTLRRQNTGYKDNELGLPAGHVDGGESVFRAMQREAMEEIGIRVAESDLDCKHVLHRQCGDHERIDYFFYCHNWEGEPINTEPEKCSELVWHSVKEYPHDFIDYYKHVFDEIEKGSIASAIDFN